jgi:hypothetical protein
MAPDVTAEPKHSRRFFGTRARIALLCVVAVGAAASFALFGSSSSLDPVAAAGVKTADTGAANATLKIEVAGPVGEATVVTAQGSFDQDAAELSVNLSGPLGSAGGILAGTDVKLIYLEEDGDPVVYAEVPSLAASLAGKSWVRVDLASVDGGLGGGLDKALGEATESPGQALALLQASGDIQKVGPDPVNGVPATEYQGTIDLAEAAGADGLSQSLVDRLVAGGAPSKIPVTVWIGDDGLVHRMLLTAQVNDAGQLVTTSVSLDVSGFGAPVTVTAPPASDVFDLTNLVQKGLGFAHTLTNALSQIH